jgi:FAD binding domain/Berberine and berberine like
MTDVRAGDLDALRTTFDGSVLVPGDAPYDGARSIWNGDIDRRPAVIAQPVSTGAVAAAIRFGRQAGLEISVRGGGHNFSGSALVDGGLTIDLSAMRNVSVDHGTRRVTCGGGATWLDVDGATQEHALAVPGGFVSHTGVGGLTLGGGFGWLSRLGGLSCDNLLAAELVTVDGDVLRVTDASEPELMWALRGGGGNFGVVTSFEFGLHPVGPLINLGLFFYGLDQGGDVFRLVREMLPTMPDESFVFVVGLNAPPEPFVPEQYHFAPGYAVVVVGFGSAEHHAELIAPVTGTMPCLWNLVTPMPYVQLQQMFDPASPWGIRGYEKAVYLDEMSDGAIDVITRCLPQKVSPMSLLPIFTLGGAFGRVPDDATAFGGSRSTKYIVNIAAMAEAQDVFEADRAWVRAFWSELVPFAAGIGSYVNFMSEFEENRVRASYGSDKYERLAAVKARYDPENVLHINANVIPA